MIEKLGHTKRIQTMRKEWIEEEKPKLYRDEADPVSERRGTVDLPTRPQKQDDSLQGAGADGEGDADADALFIPDANTSKQPDTAQSHPEPDDDDLEDLLREEEEMAGIQQSGTAQTTSNGNSNGNGDFDDFDADYEAMNEMGL